MLHLTNKAIEEIMTNYPLQGKIMGALNVSSYTLKKWCRDKNSKMLTNATIVALLKEVANFQEHEILESETII